MFQKSSISDIKSISQRMLALSWSRAAGTEPMPDFQSFEMPSRGHDPNYLVTWKIDQTPHGPSFQAMFQGSHIAVAFRQDWQGKKMEEMIPPPLLCHALEAARFSANNKLGVYMIYSTVDRDGYRLDCERMLLPFGSSSGPATVLLASMEPFSLQGNVVLSGALDHFVRSHEVIFAGSFGVACKQSDA